MRELIDNMSHLPSQMIYLLSQRTPSHVNLIAQLVSGLPCQA